MNGPVGNIGVILRTVALVANTTTSSLPPPQITKPVHAKFGVYYGPYGRIIAKAARKAHTGLSRQEKVHEKMHRR